MTSKDLKTRMSKDSGKTEALTTAPREKEEALITAPRPSEGGIPGPGPKADKSDEKKKDEGGPSRTVPESTLASRHEDVKDCLLYTSPSPRDRTRSRMPSSA